VLDRLFAPGARFAPVLLRVIVGIVAVLHGWPKLKSLSPFIERVAKLGLPFPAAFATAAALSEFLGGILLLVGLFTRYAALCFGCTMAMAVFKVHWINGFYSQNKGYEYPLVLLVGCVSLLLTGAGPVSIDHWVGRKK
jgi:putative oxidoreductase